MILLTFAVFLFLTFSGDVPLKEKIDFYHPVTGAYEGNEINRFGPDGRRLRWETNDAKGKNTLLFIVSHDSEGRESKAVYFEGGSKEPSFEYFTYAKDRRSKTTNYVSRTGAAADRTESDLDEKGRVIRKRYYRADGTLYGAEQVLWNKDETKNGWDFKYVGREGGASFRYKYLSFDKKNNWNRRLKLRDGNPERIEVRTLTTLPSQRVYTTPARFGQDVISTGRSESSPSFSKDGKTMVFARYGDEWTRKDPYIAHLKQDGWKVEAIRGIGKVYNLAISPNGNTIIYAKRIGDSKSIFRIRSTSTGWSNPENLTVKFGVAGTYPALTENGDLLFFDAEGTSGSGIYIARETGEGFGEPLPVFVTEGDTTFDPFSTDGKKILVSRCFDEVCNSGPRNGIWEITPDGKGGGATRKIPRLPYGWCSQIVEYLVIFVYTDGEDILAVPLGSSGIE